MANKADVLLAVNWAGMVKEETNSDLYDGLQDLLHSV